MSSSKSEQLFMELWSSLHDWDPPAREYRFHPVRRWRFDFAWPAFRVAVEIHGATFQAGRHSRGAGQAADFEKLGEAQALGWQVLQFTSHQLQREPDWCLGVVQAVLSRAVSGNPSG